MVQIACECGSIYEVTTHHAPMGDSGVAICKVCSREMDRWNNVTVYETYVLVQAKEHAAPISRNQTPKRNSEAERPLREKIANDASKSTKAQSKSDAANRKQNTSP